MAHLRKLNHIPLGNEFNAGFLARYYGGAAGGSGGLGGPEGDSGGHNGYDSDADLFGKSLLYDEIYGQLYNSGLRGQTLADQASHQTEMLHQNRMEMNQKFWDMERARTEETVIEWEIVNLPDGSVDLYHAGYQQTFSQLLENTKKYARETNQPRLYNEAEAQALLYARDALIDGAETNAISFVYHPDSVRYATQLSVKSGKDGRKYVESRYIDATNGMNRDMTHDEARSVAKMLDHGRHQTETGFKPEYPVIFADRSFTAGQIKSLSQLSMLKASRTQPGSQTDEKPVPEYRPEPPDIKTEWVNAERDFEADLENSQLPDDNRHVFGQTGEKIIRDTRESVLALGLFIADQTKRKLKPFYADSPADIPPEIKSPVKVPVGQNERVEVKPKKSILDLKPEEIPEYKLPQYTEIIIHRVQMITRVNLEMKQYAQIGEGGLALAALHLLTGSGLYEIPDPLPAAVQKRTDGMQPASEIAAVPLPNSDEIAAIQEEENKAIASGEIAFKDDDIESALGNIFLLLTAEIGTDTVFQKTEPAQKGISSDSEPKMEEPDKPEFKITALFLLFIAYSRLAQSQENPGGNNPVAEKESFDDNREPESGTDMSKPDMETILAVLVKKLTEKMPPEMDSEVDKPEPIVPLIQAIILWQLFDHINRIVSLNRNHGLDALLPNTDLHKSVPDGMEIQPDKPEIPEAGVHSNSAPVYLLLAIIWYLAQIREQGMSRNNAASVAPVNNMRSKKTNKLRKKQLPDRGIIYVFSLNKYKFSSA